MSEAPKFNLTDMARLETPTLELKYVPAGSAPERPVVKSIKCDVEFKKETAQMIFKSLVFEEEDKTVVITEVLRPVKAGEKGAVHHLAAGQNFVVDHYEFDGVVL